MILIPLKRSVISLQVVGKPLVPHFPGRAAERCWWSRGWGWGGQGLQASCPGPGLWLLTQASLEGDYLLCTERPPPSVHAAAGDAAGNLCHLLPGLKADKESLLGFPHESFLSERLDSNPQLQLLTHRRAHCCPGLTSQLLEGPAQAQHRARRPPMFGMEEGTLRMSARARRRRALGRRAMKTTWDQAERGSPRARGRHEKHLMAGAGCGSGLHSRRPGPGLDAAEFNAWSRFRPGGNPVMYTFLPSSPFF